MSVHVLSHVLRYSEAKLGARLVLIVLADHARDDGSMAWPAVETIAEQARMSRRAVQMALRKLEEDGEIVVRGKSRTGTTIYDVVMRPPGGGADSAPGRISTHVGAQNPAKGGEAASPDPSKSNHQGSETPFERAGANGEHPEFGGYLAHHIEIAAGHGISQSVPREGTSYRKALADSYAALRGEGYSSADLEMACEGLLADPHMRQGGWTKPENVLRKTKIGGRIDAGRLWRESGPTSTVAKYGQFDG